MPLNNMPTVDDLKRTRDIVLSQLKPFQQETVKRVEQLFASGAQRVLVADEVGLGKTLIARGTIATTAVRRKEKGDPLFKVAYICSNGAIANQNLSKLSIDKNFVHRVDSSESRLSMQHLVAYENELYAKEHGQYIQLIPLTPGTSFYVTVGSGIVQERALMFEVLRRHELFQSCEAKLSALLHGGVNDGTWNYWTSKDSGTYRKRVDKAGPEYLEDVFKRLEGYRSELVEIRDCAIRGERAERAPAVRRLRGIFARISASGLDPDLVIMDEFQRFRNLLTEDRSSELGMLSERFLLGNAREDDPVQVLLLSATPFKSYSTAAEDESFFGSESQQDFIKVVDFLSPSIADKADFKAIWDRYGHLLAEIGEGTTAASPVLRDAKSNAEQALRRIIARSERASLDEYRDIIKDRVQHITPDKRDVASFIAARRLMERFGTQQTFAPEYSESCPYLLSYLKGYKLGEKFEKAVRKQQGKFNIKRSDNSTASLLWLSMENIRYYRKLNIPNTRFTALQEDVFATDCRGFDASALLWVPPSLPYYQVSSGPFAGAQGFSKTLVFSSWTMVPRMMSTLLSYEDERRSLQQCFGSRSIPYTYFDETGAEDAEAAANSASKRRTNSGSTRTLPSGRLHFLPEARGPVYLIYPSPCLASCVDWSELGIGRSLSEIREVLTDSIEGMLRDIGITSDSRREANEDLRWMLKTCFLLDAKYSRNPDYVEKLISTIEQVEGASSTMKKSLAEWRQINEMDIDQLGGMPRDLARRLADIALGSPAVCAIRLFRRCPGYSAETDPTLAFEFAYAFTRKMNTPASTLAIDACYPPSRRVGSHWKNVLDYCIAGNLQSVLDEYGHQLGFDNSASTLCNLMIGENVSTFRGPSLYTMQSQYEVETLLSFRGKTIEGNYPHQPMRMRTDFAATFMADEGGGRNDHLRDNMRRAFNSPFRPFVLVSTSVGQEGLDFHAYCRKIVHWNLPSNPIDLEQREGRINRYESLALRQNLAAGEDVGFTRPNDDIWDTLFKRADRRIREIGVGKAGLIPHWGLDRYAQGLMVERHAYLRRFGREETRYQRLIDVLVRYRAVLGMPRQEELLDVLSAELSIEEIKDLFINLCPFVYRNEDW